MSLQSIINELRQRAKSMRDTASTLDVAADLLEKARHHAHPAATPQLSEPVLPQPAEVTVAIEEKPAAPAPVQPRPEPHKRKNPLSGKSAEEVARIKANQKAGRDAYWAKRRAESSGTPATQPHPTAEAKEQEDEPEPERPRVAGLDDEVRERIVRARKTGEKPYCGYL